MARGGAVCALALLLCGASPVHAESRSASYILSDATFDGGVRPAASTSFKITNPTLGSGLESGTSTSVSFHLDPGFTATYLPPGEVRQVHFNGLTTLEWNPDRAIGTYALYRDLVSALASGSGGTCRSSELATETATDAELPGTGSGFFYLVTARSRLGEEGTRGQQSDGTERSGGAPCP